MSENREHLKAVIVGHVDHGKSTILGRLLADTGSLPKGKLEDIRLSCERNSKPFEYAFLLDALKNERSQGITIDMARCFFKTEKRDYMVMDAPGHIEFLKNMVTGAARADAALLVIDAQEGIRENSRRHGYMLSILGVPQLAVLINKIDLVNYSEEVCKGIVAEYSEFLKSLGVTAASYIPLSGREGDNIATRSAKTPWHKGPTVLEQLESFERAKAPADGPFRLPVQDIYKFTEESDERRIVAGTIVSGTVRKGDELVFLPSGKSSVVKSIEEFNAPERESVSAPCATGLTLTTQIYAKPGEIACKKGEPAPLVASRFKANVFWLSRNPLVKNRRYKIKLAAARVSAELSEVVTVIDASELSSIKGKSQLDRHDVGICVFESSKPVAFDKVDFIGQTGRFVIVDNYEIAGGGVILEALDSEKSKEGKALNELAWDSGLIGLKERSSRNRHIGKSVIFAGPEPQASKLAKAAEAELFRSAFNTYYLGISKISGLGAAKDVAERDEAIERLGGLAKALTDAGLIFFTAVDGLDEYELAKLKELGKPYELLIVEAGAEEASSFNADLRLGLKEKEEDAVRKVIKLLSSSNVIPEYVI